MAAVRLRDECGAWLLLQLVPAVYLTQPRIIGERISVQILDWLASGHIGDM